MAESEVALLRARIERECEALSLLARGAMLMGGHTHISSRYQRLGEYQEQLDKLVGSEEAVTIICDIYNETI
jgi:hypothetical protein